MDLASSQPFYLHSHACKIAISKPWKTVECSITTAVTSDGVGGAYSALFSTLPSERTDRME